MGGVCVIGSFMMDLVVRVARRPRPGETIIGTDFARFLGGKGFNQAVAAARAGADTSMIGRVGDDEFGREFVHQMVRDGISHAHVIIDPVLGTGIGAPVVEEGGENSIVVVPRANAAVSVYDVESAAVAIGAADVLLLQLELPVDTAVAACSVARAASTMVVLNPAPARDAHPELRGLVDILVPNEGEAAVLIGGAGRDVRELAELWGCRVVMTAAAAGCVVADAGSAWRSPSFVVDPVDTVGAGDAFCGTLAAQLANGSPLEHAVRHANAAGAIAVTRLGAEPAMPWRHEVVELVERSGMLELPGA